MNNSTRNISVITCLIISIIVGIISFFANYALFDEIYWAFIFIISITVFCVSFIAFDYTFEKLVNKRIKLIYKTIHNFKLNKTEKKEKSEKDIFEIVNKDVEEWIEKSGDEIEQLKKLEKFRKEFIGNISHELKTPIFSIQGYISTLIDGGLNDPEINMKYLERTEKNIERLINIVNDLDIISRLESGEIKLEIKEFDMVYLAREVIEELELKAKAKNITIKIAENHDKPIRVLADRDRIQQVLTNLINNSIIYGNTDGQTKISFFDMDENILVEVSDNGIGIEEKNLSRIFERFYRTDKSRSREQGGTGLGLAIVKHIIEAHKQIINVRSTVGVGSTFAFTLKKV
ncbi:MAG: ATP-binding protein [Bacteroidales bacterium]|jgi:two-component system phosphate regulon sensor histidine kinase PhoR